MGENNRSFNNSTILVKVILDYILGKVYRLKISKDSLASEKETRIVVIEHLTSPFDPEQLVNYDGKGRGCDTLLLHPMAFDRKSHLVKRGSTN